MLGHIRLADNYFWIGHRLEIIVQCFSLFYESFRGQVQTVPSFFCIILFAIGVSIIDVLNMIISRMILQHIVFNNVVP